jgi:hypothetical protein
MSTIQYPQKRSDVRFQRIRLIKIKINFRVSEVMPLK